MRTIYEFRWKGYLCPFDTWEEAAEDAVKMGVGRWLNKHEFQLDWPATIKAVHHGDDDNRVSSEKKDDSVR